MKLSERNVEYLSSNKIYLEVEIVYQPSNNDNSFLYENWDSQY